MKVQLLFVRVYSDLQWQKRDSLEAIKEKQNYLKAHCKNKRLKFNFHDLQTGFLEGVLSRGDRRLSKVILSAYQKGARFDAWSNHFSFNKWLEAFSESGINPQKYLQEKPASAVFAWDFIDIGIDKEELLSEFNKSIVR